MHRNDDIVFDRIERIRRALEDHIYGAEISVPVRAHRVGRTPIPFADAVRAEFRELPAGTAWGSAWETWWFRFDITEAPKGEGPLELVIDPGFVGDWPGNQVEGLLWDSNGAILKAVNPQNYAWRLPEGQRLPLTVYMEAASNPDIMAKGWVPTPQGDIFTATDEPLYVFKEAKLRRMCEEAFGAHYDIEILLELAKELPRDSTRRACLLAGLNRAAAEFDFHDVEGTARHVREKLSALLGQPAAASAHRLHAVGHGHIDCAWLWPLRETRRKVARTFSNVLWLMEQYPDFRFACSSAQQYEWIREDYPQLIGRIQAAVARGQWLPVGGMWVEPDGNLPGGESLIRQLIVGQQTFVDLFGARCQGMWIPDSFGYTASYPQIAKHAEMQWFLTQKISWNQTNDFPHHSFWWEGIDGTRLFTHFCPVDCYDSIISPKELLHAEHNFREKGVAENSLLPFGHGDGGGGPNRVMMERARRCANLEGLPRVSISTPDAFFAQARAEYGDAAPTWVGELYLELHRGTYTTQSELKWWHRRAEVRLHTAEYVWSLGMLEGAAYPHEELTGYWKRLLLMQFHDILPGSSIAWVHREALAELKKICADVDASIERAVEALGAQGSGYCLNASPAAATAGGAAIPAYTAAAALAGAHGGTIVREGLTVTTDELVVRFKSDGTLASIWDRARGRELLAGAGNVFALYDDVPNNWDAWDLDRHHMDRRREVRELESFAWEEDPDTGSVSALIEWRAGESRISERVTVRAGSRWIDFDVTIDWHEKERILKWENSTTLRAGKSQAEVQFGYVERPTHENTSWEHAAFERYAHRWVRLDEGGYGCGLANDGTHGYSVRRERGTNDEPVTRLCLSVMRAPLFPDPTGEPGLRRRSWSLGCGVSIEQCVDRGYELNGHRLAVSRPLAPLFQIHGDTGVYIDTVKAAEDGSGDVVVRLYEALGRHAAIRVVPSFMAGGVYGVNLYEEPSDVGPMITAVNEGAVEIEMTPFALKTLRYKPERGGAQ